MRPLTSEEKSKLFEIIDSEEKIYKVAAYLLLDNNEQAMYYLNQLDHEQKEQFLSFPISCFLVNTASAQ